MSLTDKQKAAKKLGVEFKEDTTEVELDKLIAEKEEKNALEKEQDRIKKENEKAAALAAKKAEIVLKDTSGEDVEQEDYFFPEIDEKTKEIKNKKTAPSYFNRICGYPVTADREEILEVFNLIFPPHKKFLFYKLRDKEVYLVIVPRKYAKTISKYNESMKGDFQKHAISFIGEGSVNLDTLKMRLTRIANHGSSISTE